jgi:hypothetical protein
MKTTGIILSILGTGLLVTGIVMLVKQKKSETKSGFCGCENYSAKRAIKSSVNPYDPKAPK